VVESVKAASDVYAPVAGEVIASNSDVESSPEAVNKDAYAAWMFRMKPANTGDVNELLDAAAYQKLVESEAH
jgi:glycine cleavage system H protein